MLLDLRKRESSNYHVLQNVWSQHWVDLSWDTGCPKKCLIAIFSLNTLSIPIQNIRSSKNACTDIIFPPAIALFMKLELCRPNEHAKRSEQQRVLLFPLQSMKCASMCFMLTTENGSGEKMMYGHTILMFLGHFIFWMGVFKVFGTPCIFQDNNMHTG